MARRKGQDELTRQRRLNDGACPTHGIALHMGIPYRDRGLRANFYCPRSDCDFKQVAIEDSKLWKAVCGATDG